MLPKRFVPKEVARPNLKKVKGLGRFVAALVRSLSLSFAILQRFWLRLLQESQFK
jgi:hypothetical protein